jgi:hypothetical protein
MDDRYAAVLDVFALVATYPREAHVLRMRTQREALLFLEGKPSTTLLTLLQLALDLGYVDEALLSVHKTFLK